jgi:hypothetical protein
MPSTPIRLRLEPLNTLRPLAATQFMGSKAQAYRAFPSTELIFDGEFDVKLARPYVWNVNIQSSATLKSVRGD